MAAAMARADEGYATLERHRRGSPTVAQCTTRAHQSYHGRNAFISATRPVAPLWRAHTRAVSPLALPMAGFAPFASKLSTVIL